MSIGPVGSSVPVPEPQSPETSVRSAPRTNSTSENDSSRETSTAKNASAAPAATQDEVRVQWDTPMADYIEIYQFVNQQSGSLILQEPNQEMLSLIHQIQEMLQSTAQQAASASSDTAKSVE